jgi:hypothetical protein
MLFLCIKYEYWTENAYIYYFFIKFFSHQHSFSEEDLVLPNITIG